MTWNKTQNDVAVARESLTEVGGTSTMMMIISEYVRCSNELVQVEVCE